LPSVTPNRTTTARRDDPVTLASRTPDAAGTTVVYPRSRSNSDELWG
jgi:hypothetical protein